MTDVYFPTRFMLSPAWLMLPPRLRGGYVAIVGYAAQRGSGRIRGAAAWTDREWQVAGGDGCTRADVERMHAAGMLKIDGADVVVPLDRRGRLRLERVFPENLGGSI